MVRVLALRLGYGAFAAAFAVLAVSALPVSGAILPLGLVLALGGALALAFCRDPLPRWAGVAVLAFFALVILAFVASTPVTVNKGSRFFFNDDPHPLFRVLFDALLLATPVMLGAAAALAAWERERPARNLLLSAAIGLGLVFLLSFVLAPSGVRGAIVQGGLLKALFGVSALAGAAGAAWCAARPEEFD